MPEIQIPSPLRQYTGQQSAVSVPGKTVGEALAGLVSQHPDLKRHLYNDDGKLRAFVNVYVNDEDMRYLLKEATTLKDGDIISIVPSIAGGS
jgi:molybdopterin converting factor small subunit